MTDIAPTEPAPVPEETPQVEIHKVKPIHGWRDFAKELGTIVLGIIIAISLERFVEEWSWEKEVTAAREAIHAEMAANNENLFAFRIAIAPCMDRELAKADRILTALEAGRDPGGSTSLRTPPGALLRDAEWQSERASQVLTHFPRAELTLMSRYYAQLPDFRGWGGGGDGWRRLGALAKLPKATTASDLIGLRADLRAAQDAEDLLVLNAKRELRLSRQLGLANPTIDPVRVRNWCTLDTDAFRRYRSSQDLR
jgi:hypothetical protein